MAKVVKRDGEDLDSLLRRFKRKVNDDGILADIKKHEFYRSPAQKKREKRKEAEAKRRKFERMQRKSFYQQNPDWKPTYRPRNVEGAESANE